MTQDTFTRHLHILNTLNVEAFVEFIKEFNDPKELPEDLNAEDYHETLLAAMHKSRWAHEGISEKKKQDSKRWLKARGMGPRNGEEF
jgi:hypothetical protein